MPGSADTVAIIQPTVVIPTSPMPVAIPMPNVKVYSELIKLVESFMKLNRDEKMAQKLKEIDEAIDNLSDIQQLNNVLAPLKISIDTEKYVLIYENNKITKI